MKWNAQQPAAPGWGYVLAGLAIVVVTAGLWLAQAVLNLGSVYLIYLVAVVVVAAWGGGRAGVLAAVLAFLAANYFFITPRFTFTIADPQDILALIIFLALASGTSGMLDRLREETAEVRRQSRAAAKLYAQNQALLEEATQAEVLRRTDALRVALLSTVAHDLRGPLAAIHAATTSLLSRRFTWSPADQQALLETVVGQVTHINALIGNLLDAGRIEAGQLRPHKELCAMGDLIGRVLERLTDRLADHPVTTAISADLPRVPFDAVELDEVLTNLLENAVKHTPVGTPIRVSALRDGPVIRVNIADRGPGIAAEHIPHLFDRYYRVPATHAVGFGLGLAIAKSIVEAHGGTITVACPLTGGTVFTFTLPIAPAAPQLVATAIGSPPVLEEISR